MTKVRNAVLDACWQAAQEKVIEHCEAVFAATAVLPEILGIDVMEIGPHAARLTLRLSDGHMVHEDFDPLEAVIADGALATMPCFGVERPQ